MAVKSSVPGVYWRPKLQKYVASFRHAGVYKYFGCFPTIQEAERVVAEYREQHEMDSPSNWYEQSGDTTTLHIRRRDGSTVTSLIDSEDYEKVCTKIWCATYCESNDSFYINQAGYKGVKLHRLITGAAQGFDVDHVNRRTTDNRKSNLRVVTRGQNLQNRGVAYKNNVSSGVRGVTYMSRDNTWQAHCQIDKHKYTVGLFNSVEEAAAAVKEFRLKHMPFSEMDKEKPNGPQANI